MIEFAVKIDGGWRILDAGPATMIAFEDEFGQSMPDGADGGHLWRHLLWIAFRIESPDEPFATWVDRVEDITGQDDRIEAIRAELDSGDPPEQPLEAVVVGESG